MLLQAYFNFRDIIAYLQEMGVYEIFLPFLLIFAIVFAILEKTSILGKEKTNINAIVSLVIGLLLIVQKGIVETINTFLPRVSLIMVVILMFLLLVSMVAGKEFKGLQNTFLTIVIIGIIISLYFALSPSDWLTQDERDALLRIGVPIGIFVLVFFLVTGGKKQAGEEGFLKKFDRAISEGLK